jgi:hypothetical protein
VKLEPWGLIFLLTHPDDETIIAAARSSRMRLWGWRSASSARRAANAAKR